MSTQVQNAAEYVREMYETAAKGDVEGFLDHLGDDFVLEEPAWLPYGGTYHGHDGMRQVFAAASSILDLTSLKIHYVFGDGERVCAVVELPLASTGEPRSILEEWVVRDGKVRWGRVFWYDPSLS